VVERIILVGTMGVGKTTVGRTLADRLGWPHHDSDAQVMAVTGRTVPQLFAERGEAAFRAEESRVLAASLSGADPVVVSAAGGVVLSEDNRELVARSGTVVWLRADPGLLARRVGSGEGRPLLEDDPAGTLRRLDEARRPLYASVAHVTVDVDGATPDEVVDQILAHPALEAVATRTGPNR
jgi:shikimate kinase